MHIHNIRRRNVTGTEMLLTEIYDSYKAIGNIRRGYMVSDFGNRCILTNFKYSGILLEQQCSQLIMHLVRKG